MTYDEWLELCPDKPKFLMEYVDIRSDILNVITTYEKSVNPDKEDELVDIKHHEHVLATLRKL